jgi:hypothetical protein
MKTKLAHMNENKAGPEESKQSWPIRMKSKLVHMNQNKVDS